MAVGTICRPPRRPRQFSDLLPGHIEQRARCLKQQWQHDRAEHQQDERGAEQLAHAMALCSHRCGVFQPNHVPSDQPVLLRRACRNAVVLSVSSHHAVAVATSGRGRRCVR
jgi:hypothetical protein